MNDLAALYARYDGPLPRPALPPTGKACWEQMLRGRLLAAQGWRGCDQVQADLMAADAMELIARVRRWR